MNTVNLKLYYRVKYFQLVMLDKRGYILNNNEKRIISEKLGSTGSYNLFKSIYLPTDDKTYLQEKLSKTYEHTSNNPEKISKVIFVREVPDEKSDKILTETTNVIKNMIKDDPSIKNVILIVRVPFRSINYADLKNLVSYNIEIFLHSELFYDPTDHELQPRFKLVSIEESKNFLSANKDNRNIKVFCIDDPVIKFLGGTYNQLVAVYRTLSYIAQTQEGMEYRLITKQTITEHMKKEPKKD